MKSKCARPRRSPGTRGNRRAGGFTLLEMIVAIALLSLAMLALSAGVGSALRTLLPSAQAIEAAQIAHARLDGLCVDPALRAQSTTGSEGPARWTLDVTAAAREPGTGAVSVQMLQARLIVSIGTRNYRFDTACAAALQQPVP